MSKDIEKLTVRYTGENPAVALRRWCDAHADRVQDVDLTGGYDFGRGEARAYNVLLRPGWRMGDDWAHTLIEPSARAMLAQLRAVVPCDCDDCTAAAVHGRRAW